MYYISFLPIPESEADRLEYARNFFAEGDDDSAKNPHIDRRPLADRLLQLFPGTAREEDEKNECTEVSYADRDDFVFELYDDWILLYVDVPLANPEQTWKTVWPALEMLQLHGGLDAYDEQLDQLINPSTDLPNVVQSYVNSQQAQSQKSAVNPQLQFTTSAVIMIIFAIFVTFTLSITVGNQIPRGVFVAIWAFFGIIILTRYIKSTKS